MRLVPQLICFVVSMLFSSLSHGQMIVAHRGASHAAPENTLSAFRLAWEEQADGIEGDFYYTKDQHVVCIHDADTKRTGGIKLKVADSTLEELRSLEFGSWKDPRYAGEPIPTFAEVLETVPSGKWFIIELKTGPEIVPLLQRELQRLRPDRSKLWVIAFNAATVAAVKTQLPDLRTHWLTGYKHDEKSGEWRPTAEEVAETLRQCKADGLGTQGKREVVDEKFIEILRSQGLGEFHVWTIDDPADAHFFRFLGACGITTNTPLKIRKELRIQEHRLENP